MNDKSKTKGYLLREIADMRRRVGELHKAENLCRQAERQLRQQSDFLNSVLESIPHPLYVINVSDFIIKIANSAARRSGITEETTCYASTHGRDKPCDSEEHSCPLEVIRKTRQPMTVEHRHYDGDGSLINVEVNCYPVYDSNGELVRIIEHVVDITERKKAEERLTYMATHDSLTGLPNRTLFNDRLALEIAHARRNRQSLAVLLLDIDNFKEINDTLGHSAGDKLLQCMAGTLTTLLRKSDTVARMGGDEFLFILPEIAKPEDAATVAGKLQKALRNPFVCKGEEFDISTSIGIALFPRNGEDVESLVKNADIAMYRAKREGRDNYQFFALRVKP